MKYIMMLMGALLFMTGVFAQDTKADVLKTKSGDLKMVSVGHGTLYFEFDKKIIHVDPYSKAGDYSKMPKADIILITHDHGDHLDTAAIDAIKTKDTQILLTKNCFDKLKAGDVMKNGDVKTVKGIKIQAVPAYNIKNKRDNGAFYHPKGDGNGYVLSFADKNIYVAGDTENVPEMKNLKNIDVAFLPMNLPFTMDLDMAKNAISLFKPKIAYMYHIGKSDTAKFLEMMKGVKGTEVRIRVSD